MNALPPSSSASWRRVLRVVAVGLLLATVGGWAALGAHRGWSQNRVPVQKTDEITGIEFIEYEDRFVPGVDVLALGVGVALLAGGVSFWPRRAGRAPAV